MKTTDLKITGMTCASCVRHIENDLKEMKGVETVAVNFATETGMVTHDEKVTPADLIRQIKATGYGAEETGGHSHGQMSHGPEHEMKGGGNEHAGHARSESETHLRDRFRKFAAALALSIPIILLSFSMNFEQKMEVMMVLSLLILLYSGKEFFVRGIPSLFRGRPGMDTLVALGVGAAFLYSSYVTLFTEIEEEYFMDVAIITTFILLGRYLEAKAKGRAREAIKKLLELSAKVAHRVGPDGSVSDIPTEEVRAGDRLKVKPGEKIPVDGVITEGAAIIDESMVTGESIPVDKKQGDPVIGATINGNTSFVMEAVKVGSDTVLAQIVRLVEQAQMSKAPIQKLVDTVSAWFVWGVIAVAIVAFLAWSFVMKVPFSESLIHTVAILVIACPCALGLATPISIVVASGKGASMGILIKNMEALEKVHQINAIAFDKTGTITKGEPTVQKFEHFGADEKKVLAIATAIESESEHPLARSVVKFALEKGILPELPVKNFESKIGLGVKGEIEGRIYYFGSSAYARQLGLLSGEVEQEIHAMQEEGHTVLILAEEKQVIGIFAVQDQLKENSASVIRHLKKRGIRTVMLTGDNEKVARHIAGEVGIDEVHSGVTPDRKKEIIEKLQKEGLIVAMAGDGINDSPALAQADVGIAMGTGTDIAMETGDLVLVKGDLMKAVEAIELSRATLRNIKQNLFWAFVYNSVGIPVAALGFLSPAFSAAAMGFSSVSVVLNALRLKRFKFLVN